MMKISEDTNAQFPPLGNVYRKPSAKFCSNNVASKSAQVWNSSGYSSQSAWKSPELIQKQKEKTEVIECQDKDEDDEDELYGSSDEDFSDSDLELERTDKTHETHKKNKRFRDFFVYMDGLAVEALNSKAKEWHCPVCKGGPGAIDRYRGLMPLMHHATTIKTRRVKLHRIFAEILNEEACRRGIVIAPDKAVAGRWEGLNENVNDHQIVWPPMVVIVNTRCEEMENGMWNGMGSQELLDHFHSFAATKARHAYGPKGHRGISVLLFDDSAAGYFEAERLHKHLKEQGRGRHAWLTNKAPRFIAGRRQLFGYIASKEDIDEFNLHSQGRSRKLKFEMRSYQEVVEAHVSEMNEKVQCKEECERKKKHVEVLAETVVTLSRKLHRSSVDNCDLRQRTMSLLEQNKEEMDCQDVFIKEQLQVIHRAIDEKEPNAYMSSESDSSSDRMEDEGSIRRLKEEHLEEVEKERKKLMEELEEKKELVMKRCKEELIELEKEFQNQVSRLMEKYSQADSAAEISNE